MYAGAVLCLASVGRAGAPPADEGQNQDEELQMGQEVFSELKAKGEITESSPLYDQLKPIADAITAGACSVILGVMLLVYWSSASTFFIGMAVGIDLVLDGTALVGFAGAIHSL